MGKRTSYGILVILIGSMYGIPLCAQVWDTIPPPLGGVVHSHVRLGSLHYSLVAEVGDYGGDPAVPHLFRSTDDGDAWQELSVPASAAATRFRVVLDGPDRLFYLNEQAMYRTTDNGTTWTRLGASLNAAGSLAELKVDAAGRVYLLATGRGILLSTDHGSSWTDCTLPTTRQLTLFSHLACIGEDLFLWWGNAATDADTLFRSSDHGMSWSALLTGMVPRQVADGGNGKILVSRYVVASGIVPFQILSTTNTGQRWDTLYTGSVTGGFAEYRREEPELTCSDGGIIAHAIYDTTYMRSVLISSDGGGTWMTLSDPVMDYFTGIAFNARGHLLVFGLQYGFLRYLPPFTTVEQFGLFPVPVNRPPAIADDGTVYAMTEWAGVGYLFVWDGSLRTWVMVAGPPIIRDSYAESATSIFTASTDTIYTTHFNPFGTLSRTRDRGRNWEPILSTGLISYGNNSAGSGSWFAMSADSVYRSQNNGRDWSAIPTPAQGRPNPVAEVGGTVVFLGYMQSRIWRRGDPDSAWISRPLPWRCKELVTGSGAVLYLRSAYTGAFVGTTDLGDSWVYPETGYGNCHQLLAVGSSAVLSLDTTRGLAHSPDRGQSWMWRDLPDAGPRSMAMKDGMLYLGTQRLGILRTPVAPLLAAITQLQPGNLVGCLPPDVILEWSVQNLSGPFQVRCSTSPSFPPATLVTDTTITGTTLVIGHLSPGTTYFWDVTAGGGAGGQKSPVFQFSTASLPSTDITSPSSGAGCVNPSGDMTWTMKPCVSSSEVEFSNDVPFQNIVSSVHVQGDVSRTTFSLGYGTHYYARVRSTSAAGTGPWSPVVAFRTIDSIVTAPLQIQPADQSTITVGPPGLIQWEKVDCVQRSEIIVARVQDFSTDTVAHEFKLDPYNDLAMSGGQWTNGTYYWKVRAWRDTVPGYWSPTWSFTLDIPVDVETTSPAEDFNIVRVYPMPAGGPGTQVIVDCVLPGAVTGEVIVCDLLGRERLRVPVAASASGRQSIAVDISALPAGQYQLRLHAGSRHASTPLVIVR